MSTLLDVGSASLTLIGQLGQGQSPNAEDGAQILYYANLLLDQKSTDRLFLYTITPVLLTLTGGVGDYTIGPTGSFAQARPTFIEGCQVNVGTGAWVPLSVLDKTKWDAIRSKDAQASLPDDFWPEYTFPNIGLHFNPKPTGNVQISLGCWLPLAQFATLFDNFNFPPAYQKWLVSNLAIILCDAYDQPVTPSLLAQAQRDEAQVMKINAQGMGGAVSAQQQFQSPNVGQPILPQGPQAGA